MQSSPAPSQLTIIAGTPGGGGQDRVARAVAAAAAELGHPAHVVNIPGRGGGNGWDTLVAQPDPHTVAVSSPTLVTNRLLGDGDLDHRMVTPVAMLCTESLAFVVRRRGDLLSAAALLERFADSPPVVAFATAAGNVNHMALARAVQHTGTDPQVLDLRVFDSARYAVRDVIAGHSELAVVSAASAVAELESGELRALAVTSAKRLDGPYEDVPTWTELDVPATIGTWRGLVGPGDLDATHLDFWQRLSRDVLSTSAWSSALTQHRWLETYRDATATAAMLGECAVEYATVLAALDLLPAP